MQESRVQLRGARSRRLLLGLLSAGALATAGLATPLQAGKKTDPVDTSKVTRVPLPQRPAPQFPPSFYYWGSEVPDPVEELLDRAEAAVARGEAHLAAGHLEGARAAFDHAVELLLTSPSTLQDDPRFRFGFDRLIDRMHRNELTALRDAAPAEEPPAVPAPLEELTDLPPPTFPLDPDVRSAAEQELGQVAHDLPVALNEKVLRLVEYFQRGRGQRIISTGLRRMGRYRDMIHSILQEEGVPRDLIFLAQAESAFQPHARSRARAVGMWQFISWRAREYGLEVSWWVDERRDPVKSTRAAARHLRDLYQQFGDWYLALAAYNCGPQRVETAVRRAGGQADYWTLVDRRLLPRETRNYVAIILAMALVGKNPERYDIEVIPEAPLEFETVKVSKPTDLRPIAEAIGINVEILRELNPHVLRGVTPPEREDFALYVPLGTAQTLATVLPGLPESQRVYWQQYQVRRGDTLSGIAARHDTSVFAIAQANGISVRKTIHPGDVLVIPTGGSSGRLSRAEMGERPRAPEPDRSQESRTRRAAGQREDASAAHIVRRGDTLSSIAARYGTTAAAVAQANGISLRSTIRPGDRLRVPGGSQAGAGGPSGGSGGEQRHRVRRGDTLWDLSRRYGVTVNDLRRANPYLLSRDLRAGDNLRIPD